MGFEPQKEAWFLRYTFPVIFPFHSSLTLSEPESESFTLLAPPSTTAELQGAIKDLNLDNGPAEAAETNSEREELPTEPFMKGLLSHQKDTEMEREQQYQADSENLMLTENNDMAYRSTQDPLLDLFAELEEVISGPRLYELLNRAWQKDPLMTLKLIFNARSIHLGKASRPTFYRCAGWLAQYHPITLVSSLRWLSRPVIIKKVEKTDGNGDDAVMVEAEHDRDGQDASAFDVKDGVSHGYWKDLLNILVLSVNGQLDVLANPKDILNVTRETKRDPGLSKHVDEATAKTKRHEARQERHERAVASFNHDPVHRALHVAIARLFSEQLKADLILLREPDTKNKNHISLCAKWAPSHDRFHDKHTFVVSTIAELMHPECLSQGIDREIYLRHAREAYRKDISALRGHLDIVERHLSAKTLDKIRYDRVPSIAMNRYTPIFAEKDTDHFETYTNFVAVFEDLILPMALRNNLKQEDMVKRVFVFSDMQFDEAQPASHDYGGQSSDDQRTWGSSYERLKKKYEDAGYEMPQLVFWNLAGGHAGYTGGDGDPTAPKPVTAREEGTAIVSGYSQGMLKVFLDNGSFEDEEEVEHETITEDGVEVVETRPAAKKQKMDPMFILKKAISHKAYDMLKVVD